MMALQLCPPAVLGLRDEREAGWSEVEHLKAVNEDAKTTAVATPRGTVQGLPPIWLLSPRDQTDEL